MRTKSLQKRCLRLELSLQGINTVAHGLRERLTERSQLMLTFTNEMVWLPEPEALLHLTELKTRVIHLIRQSLLKT